MSDDLMTVIEGTVTADADREDVQSIKTVLQRHGFEVAIDPDHNSITVQCDPDADHNTRQTMTKRERRLKRLNDEIQDGEAYTSDELAAIAYNIDVAEVGASERVYISSLRSSGDLDLKAMPDPDRGGNAKLYYRGDRPHIAVSDEEDDTPDDDRQEGDTAECQYCGKEYKKRGLHRHEQSCDENPDVETAWTVDRVETVMEGNGWMTVEEIVLEVLDQAVASPDERDRFHTLLNQEPELAARITSRSDPDQYQRNQYRLITDEPADKDEDSEDGLTCTACGQQFDTFEELRDHHCETGSFPCPECDKAFDDDEALQNHLRDKHPGFYGDDPFSHTGTDEDEDGEDEEELLDEMGPCNIGKIMVQGEFDRYVCQECGQTFHDETAADSHADDYNHPTFTAFDQQPEKQKKRPTGYLGGGTAR